MKPQEQYDRMDVHPNERIHAAMRAVEKAHALIQDARTELAYALHRYQSALHRYQSDEVHRTVRIAVLYTHVLEESDLRIPKMRRELGSYLRDETINAVDKHGFTSQGQTYDEKGPKKAPFSVDIDLVGIDPAGIIQTTIVSQLHNITQTDDGKIIFTLPRNLDNTLLSYQLELKVTP